MNFEHSEKVQIYTTSPLGHSKKVTRSVWIFDGKPCIELFGGLYEIRRIKGQLVDTIGRISKN